MSGNPIRIRVSLSSEVIDAIDALVGREHRSEFLTEAARRELRRRRPGHALEELAGWLKDVDVPGWETPESTAEWVREQRREATRNPWADAKRGRPEP